MVQTFTVVGEPFGKMRPRFRVVNRNVQTYSPTANIMHEREIQLSYMAQCRNFMFPEGTPIYILIDSYSPIPKSASKSRKRQMLCFQIRPKSKPDWDNIGKTVCDALNGIAYKDDAMVVDGRVRKFYANEPRMEIVISDSLEEMRRIDNV